MMDRDAIEQIVALYTKHGWKLRRVLLSDKLSGISAWPEDVEVRPSELDGLWFSRSSKPEVVTWELRHLSPAPYALVTGVPDDADAETAESILRETETKMLAARRTDGPSITS